MSRSGQRSGGDASAGGEEDGSEGEGEEGGEAEGAGADGPRPEGRDQEPRRQRWVLNRSAARADGDVFLLLIFSSGGEDSEARERDVIRHDRRKDRQHDRNISRAAPDKRCWKTLSKHTAHKIIFSVPHTEMLRILLNHAAVTVL